jgi:hypothetical protein
MKAKCVNNRGYECKLTLGKIYEIKQIEVFLAGNDTPRPYYETIDDDGNTTAWYIGRFKPETSKESQNGSV